MRSSRLIFTLALAGATLMPASAQLPVEGPAAAAAQGLSQSAGAGLAAAPGVSQSPDVGFVALQPVSQSPDAGVAALEARLAAVRSRIEGLPGRPCDLRIRWDDYLALFERTIARLGADPSAGDERAHTREGIDDLDRLVSTFEFLSNETCDLHARYAETDADYGGAREIALERFADVIAAVRGNAFPFDGADARFRDFFGRRGQWPREGNSHWSPAGMYVAKDGHDANVAALQFIESRTTVSNGVVTVNTARGRQRVDARWWTGGSFLYRNRIRHWVWEDFENGFRLATGRRTRMCGGYDSKGHCWGNTEDLMRRPTARYRLSGAFFGSLQAALQEEVTAACERTVGDRGALEDAVFDNRPADRAVREVYDEVAQEFLIEVGRLSRRGSDDLCAPDNAALMEGIAERASRSAMESGAAQVASLVYEENRRRLQDLLTRLARNLMLTHTVGPDFGLPAAEPAPDLGARLAVPLVPRTRTEHGSIW